jgi:ABC-type Zn uptake system ZnuABC Zn-binding protein ZnuA
LKRKVFLTILFFCLLLSSACSNHTDNNSSKLQVVTTYSILYDMVKQVGGDKVDIHSMVPVGANPHEYDPLPEDVMKIADADIVFYNGLNLETGNAWFQNLLTTVGKHTPDAPVYKVSNGVQPIYLETKGLEKEPDPHAWMNIENGIKYVENIKLALIKEDPKNKATYTANANNYVQLLQTLHHEAKQKIQQIPKERRYLISSEGAFKYFGKAYDIHTSYIWEINAENQGTPSQIQAVVDLIKKANIPALFVETSVDKRSMQTVSNETNVPIAGMIFTDSIDSAGKPADTYYKMMKWNIDTISNGLQPK